MTSETAVAAILSVNICGVALDALAQTLSPLVAVLPPLREWNVDDEWTPAEAAQDAAQRFVEMHGRQNEDRDDWFALEELRRHLAELQLRHREVGAVAALGDFYGYDVRAKAWYDDGPGEPTVSLLRRGKAAGKSTARIDLPAGATRRDAELVITAWEAGHTRGMADGIARIRNGVRELLLTDD